MENENYSLRNLKIAKKIATIGLGFSFAVGLYSLPKYIDFSSSDYHDSSIREEVSMVEMEIKYEQMSKRKSAADGVILAILSSIMFGGGYYMAKDIEDEINKKRHNRSNKDLESKL